ncbi:MAG: alpha/beta hydrolase [Ornithinimicrobium sp.]
MTRLAYDITGDGDPVTVYLHGVLMDRALFDPFVTAPGTHIRLDLPGHGQSPPMSPAARLEDHTDAVADTLASLDVCDALLVGHSWGGMVTVRLAHRHPRLVRAAVLCNTPWQRTTGLSRVGFHAQRALLALGLPKATYGRVAARSLVGADHRASHPDVVDDVSRRVAAMDRRQLRRTLRSVILQSGDAEGLLRDLTIPWIAVAGADDYVIAGQARQRLSELGPLEVVSGGHTSPLEQPQRLQSVIERVAHDM